MEIFKKTSIPLFLIYLRLGLSPLILASAFYPFAQYRLFIAVAIFIGLISDIFDGIIARKLNIATTNLRRMDSGVDQIFWISSLLAAVIVCPALLRNYFTEIIAVAVLEAACYAFSFIKFKKEVATHAILSKLWTLTLFALIVNAVLSCYSELLFMICFWLGIISRLEIILIILVLKKWQNDIPSIFHALKIRRET